MIDKDLIDQTKGFLDEQEGLKLYEIARAAGRMGPGLEIGSYCGKSALYLGPGLRENGSVLFSIDHHRGSEEQQPGEEYCDNDLIDPASGRIDTVNFFRQALELGRLEETVIPIVSPSKIVARQWSTPLSLVFIDGGHSPEAALADYRAWVGHIMPGGYLLIHDIFFDPAEGGQAPRRIYGRARASGLFEDQGQVKTLGILKRHAGHPPTA
ncbi:MAG: class I SAM-dependent methyltransferase, partial [Desulfosarcina sp.]|nr:class I SAM-dependent methyltransferase [Desulfobacterales bacterium]